MVIVGDIKKFSSPEISQATHTLPARAMELGPLSGGVLGSERIPMSSKV